VEVIKWDTPLEPRNGITEKRSYNRAALFAVIPNLPREFLLATATRETPHWKKMSLN
jgi:hypothetical protein